MISFQKKALTLMLVLCFFFLSSKAQTVYSNKEFSRLGLYVGMTSSNLYRDTINYSSGILASGGFSYSLWLNDRVNIALDLIYSGRALKRDSPITKYRFGYITVPLYAQYKFSESLRLNLGFDYSQYLNSQIATIDGSKKSGMNVQSFRSNLDSDYGVLAGMELDIKKDFTIGARYSYSIKSITDNNSSYFGVFQFSIGYVMYRSHKQIFGKKEIAE